MSGHGGSRRSLEGPAPWDQVFSAGVKIRNHTANASWPAKEGFPGGKKADCVEARKRLPAALVPRPTPAHRLRTGSLAAPTCTPEDGKASLDAPPRQASLAKLVHGCIGKASRRHAAALWPSSSARTGPDERARDGTTAATAQAQGAPKPFSCVRRGLPPGFFCDRLYSPKPSRLPNRSLATRFASRHSEGHTEY